MASRDDVIQILDVLQAAYPDFVMSEGAVDLYCAALHGIPNDLLLAVAHQHIQAIKSFPLISELHEPAFLSLVQPKAELAWEAIQKPSAGSASRVTQGQGLEDPVLARMAGDWEELSLNAVVLGHDKFIRDYIQIVRDTHLQELTTPEGSEKLVQLFRQVSKKAHEKGVKILVPKSSE